MPVLTTGADREALTFTLTAEFAAPPERVWQLWEDPRLLEKWWATDSTEAPSTFTFRDGFAGPDGEPVDPESYSVNTVVFTDAGGTTQMELVAVHRSLEQLERVLEMGMAEGMTEAMNQIDALL